MRLISIQVSPHQLRKLKKGHKIRLRKGTGFNLIVHPSTYNLMSRAFKKSKGIDVKLSKEELEENQKVAEEPQKMQEVAQATADDEGVPLANFWKENNPEGMGIFSKLKKGLKMAAPILKPLAKEGLKLAQPKISEKLASKPMLQKLANKGLEEAGKRLGKGIHRGRGMPRGCGVNKDRSESPPVHGLTRKVGHKIAEANNALASMTDRAIEARIKNHYPTYEELSEQPFAPFSRGYGLHGRHDNALVGRGGGMVGYAVHTAPALMSQPYSANYHMANFLPPHFQHYNNSVREPSNSDMYTGNGLYAGRGYGLFA